MRHPPIRKISLAEQAFGLRQAFPYANTSISKGILTWSDHVRPMALSMRYRLELRYQMRRPPDIWITDPNLHELADGREIPHLYSQREQELCLYYPDGREWNATKAFDRTIVPWACEWIVHFEAWLFTNHWDGGGVHAEPDKKLISRSLLEVE